MSIYDLSIIGAGWAGFNAALRAKELGLKACLIESAQIGGTCLNRGCIPTKALIQSAKIFSLAKKSSAFGIELDNPRVNFSKIQERKDKIVRQLSQGMQSRLNGVDFIKSTAEIISPNDIKVYGRVIKTKFILIATGSRPVELPWLKFDSVKIVTSDDALLLREAPQALLIIGGGVIGCEFAGLFSILGSQVSIAEKMPFLLPGEDREVAKKIEVIFKKKGIKVNTDTDASRLDLSAYAKVLVCVGRAPNITGLGLEKLGVKLEKSRIIVNEYLETNIPNIYASGDCAAQVMLAHYAAYQGETAVENMVANRKLKADNPVIPACVFTDPEIASVGLNEETARARGLAIKVHKFDFLGSPMARIIDEAEGFIKIISSEQTQEIIGASIIGPKATELIATLTLAVSARLKVSQIRAMIFAHPTLSESLRESIN
ncbi:MAG: dihydrolipoyl dehydrogenase [Candidatus Omnitrophota bacterium]|nr:dihydrolipoyl dehydrogenase [Candidatus Omnitrophota bacterium]